MPEKNLTEVMGALYASEINCSIAAFWDGGWTVKLGDDMNGFVAETTISATTDESVTIEQGAESVKVLHERLREHQGVVLGRVAEWLDSAAREHFPDSEYARG